MHRQMCIKGLEYQMDTPRVRRRVCSNGLLPNGPLMNTSSTLNFAPRLGVSYSPTSKLVIRAGYGIFFTQDIGNAYFDMARNIAGRVTINNADTTLSQVTPTRKLLGVIL